jgi:hypothetical protein
MEQPYGAGPAPGVGFAPNPRLPPYLVLLRVGFTLPPALLPERCALTAPFHPYQDLGAPGPDTGVPGDRSSSLGWLGTWENSFPGGIFSVALAVHEP